MPGPGAISHLRLLPGRIEIALNRASARPTRFTGLSGLVKLHETHHPNEQKIALIWRETKPGKFEKGGWFYDRWIKFEGLKHPPADFIGHLVGTIGFVSQAEAAARFLENYFGKQEEVFVTDWAPLASVVTNEDGYARIVSWDKEKDEIVVKTKQNITLTIDGSNLPEAAIWLVRGYEKLLASLPTIKEGVQSMHIHIERGQEYSMAASPLVIECRVSDYRSIDPYHSANFDRIIEESLQRALANRKTSP
ncbi:MAG: hypothetical protein PHH60_05655 [Candidatus Margulisbacteria bacterium]|nr:hypothetical protein [Candidatus Margulisiibacteriota bacterium]